MTDPQLTLYWMEKNWNIASKIKKEDKDASFTIPIQYSIGGKKVSKMAAKEPPEVLSSQTQSLYLYIEQFFLKI